MTRTETLGSSVRRLAKTNPAVPPPTMMYVKSSSCEAVEVMILDRRDNKGSYLVALQYYVHLSG